ncbi:mitochondrial carrier protein [Pyronema omphalodes]|nr:mitochondrial carrier protein [Pyronema omphalodes]
MTPATEVVKESPLGSEHVTTHSEEAKAAFEKFATITTPAGERAMSRTDFVNAIAPESADYHKIPRDQFGILFEVADRAGAGYLTLEEWATFESLLSKPDAEYQIVFRRFDVQGKGTVDFDDLVAITKANKSDSSLPFNWDSAWATLYAGSPKSRHSLTYEQFSQMLRAIQGEKVRQAFQAFDPKATGFIEVAEFERIVKETAGHKLSDHILDNLNTFIGVGAATKIPYANVRAFHNVMREMDTVDAVVRSATAKSKDGKITRAEFLNEAARITRFSHFTPLEADILFHFAGLDNESDRLSWKDFSRVLDPLYRQSAAAAPKPAASSNGMVEQAIESAYNFGLGAIAGAFGATMVYPIDLVKTRMQNQRSNLVGETLYKNSIDCFRKVLKNEGFKGLYSGLGPQLIGVAPEKAIKLTVNDFVRTKLTDKNGNITFPLEMLAGGTAGACQVVFTNPLEIVKIRLQVQGELTKNVVDTPRRSALWIVKNLGIVGLYKGASACLLRDVPFSAIYFPAYAHLKKDWFGESPTKPLGIAQLLTAGAIAGMPAAYLTTPCDVIKTRLQVEARKGQTSYRGLVHCATTVWKEEGYKAFFKGGPARIMRSSPQFGFTLAAYELLKTSFPLHSDDEKHGKPSVALASDPSPLSYLRSRNAMKIILDLDKNFGKHTLPADKAAWAAATGVKSA